MWPYWLFFLIPAYLAVLDKPRFRLQRDGTRSARMNGGWPTAFLSLVFLIGFRFEVGGDWGSYIRYANTSVYMTWSQAFKASDPGYWVINLIAVKSGFGISGVNILAGILFSIGLVLFCQSLPRPWLALAVAVPYMVVVVGMGYSRQAVALGIAMLGLLALRRHNIFWFLLWVGLAATFHKTAILLLPIAALVSTKNRYAGIIIVIAATAIGYRILLEDHVNAFVINYVDSSYQSSGAFIRLLMNVVPGTIFLYFRKKFIISDGERRLWSIISVISLGLFVAYFLTSASTALDRMALYMIPLQLVVFSHLPDVLGTYGRTNLNLVVGILVFYASVLFVWLNFATHSVYWLPYTIAF